MSTETDLVLPQPHMKPRGAGAFFFLFFLAVAGRVPGAPRQVVAFMPWPSADGGGGLEQACARDELGGSASGEL